MKLNVDCVRDILLVIESKNLGVQYTLEDIQQQLNNEYSFDDIYYCCYQLYNNNMIDAFVIDLSLQRQLPHIKYITELTFSGHSFLENIKNDNNWNKTKQKLNEIGSYSLDIIKEVAKHAIISNLFPNP